MINSTVPVSWKPHGKGYAPHQAHAGFFAAGCLQMRIWKRIEVVITGLTRKFVSLRPFHPLTFA